MKTERAQSGRGARRRTWIRLHRWIGLASLVVVVVIAVTGILLNHTVGLGLDQKHLSSRWLLDWYGLAPEGEPLAFQTADNWAVEWDGQIFWNSHPISTSAEGLIGAATVSEEHALVLEDAILILDQSGGLLEEIKPPSLPAEPILQAGQLQGALVIRTQNGSFILPELLTSEPLVELDEVRWMEPATLPEEQRSSVEKAFGGSGLPVSRIVLDLHSGKFFGGFGVVVYDLAAVALLILGASGVWLAISGRRRSS